MIEFFPEIRQLKLPGAKSGAHHNTTATAGTTNYSSAATTLITSTTTTAAAAGGAGSSNNNQLHTTYSQPYEKPQPLQFQQHHFASNGK